MAYFGVLAAGNLVWEIAQLPLYTLVDTTDAAGVAYAVLHCTLGDVLIAASALLVALVAMRAHDFPTGRRRAVVIATIAIGVAYTVFSEWLNTQVRMAWEYSPRMPLVPFLDVGLVPVLQWLVLPPVAFLAAFRWSRGGSGTART